nr:Chain A, SFTI-KLK5 Peptide [Helianthus annuus]
GFCHRSYPPECWPN